MTKRETLLMTTTIAALLVGILIGTQLSLFGATRFSVSERNELHGYFDIEVTKNGAVVLYETAIPNLITDIGKKHARNLFGFLNSSITNSDNRTVSLSLSNDATPLASWTKLPNEITTSGLDRKGPTEVTVTVVNSTAYKTEYTWTATATVTVQCAGVHWWYVDNSDGNLYAAGTFTQTTLNSGDTIKVTYTLNYG